MASIERTAYPRLPAVVAVRDLAGAFTPSGDEVEWAGQVTDVAGHQLSLLVLLKCQGSEVQRYRIRR